MRFFTHNQLICVKKKCRVGPLKLVIRESKIEEYDFNADFLINIIPRLNYPDLLIALEQGKIDHKLPPALPEGPISFEKYPDFLQEFNRICFEIIIVEGDMFCPNCNRLFPIHEGIPNMLLNEDES